MAYYPGHNYWVRYAASSAVINETTGAITLATAPSAMTDVGYTSPGAVSINDNTRNGYAAGRRSASYRARGKNEPSITIPIRIGSGEFIAQYCLPAGDLPEVDITFGVSGVATWGIYKAKCSNITLHLPMNDGTEITAEATFEGQVYVPGLAPVTIGFSYEEFGAALLATDNRQFTVGATDLQRNLMDMSLQVDYQLERKPPRTDWGDNVPASRTSSMILQHHPEVSGSVQLHDLSAVESALFYGGTRAMNWGDITALFSDIAASKSFDFTVSNPSPTARTQAAIDSSAQMNWTIPFIADAVTCVADDSV